MEAFIRKLDEYEVQRRYPIINRVAGWFFRMEEQSAGVWFVEGTDLWGRKVADTGTDEKTLLERCCKAAERINQEILRNRPDF